MRRLPFRPSLHTQIKSMATPEQKPVRKVLLPVYLEIEILAEDDLEAEVLAQERVIRFVEERQDLTEGVRVHSALAPMVKPLA